MNIHIITTGGTIDKVYFDAKSHYQIGEPIVGDLLERMRVNFAFTIEQAMRKDSLDIDDQDRGRIKAMVAECSAKHVLITHGSDSMVATARSLTSISNKCIVLTGALQPAAFANSDAVFNIGCAIGALHSRSNGVYIAMSGQIFEADHVQKNVAANRFESV
ncbi:MAG: asparaginase domain-containing protein [Pseudomonadota bacterium]